MLGTSRGSTTTQQPSTKVIGFNEILENTEWQKQYIKKERDAPITATARNVGFAGFTLAGALVFILFASQIITGIAAFILTAATGIGGYIGIRWLKAMDPVIKQKTKNTRLKWLMEDARNNAIYQLENLIIDKKRRLENARSARDKMQALVQKLRDKINPKNKGNPNYEKKVLMLEKVETASDKMALNIDKGAKAFEDFKRKVYEYKDMDSFTSLAGEAMAMFSSTGGKELEEMLSLEAFDSIETNFNEAIISIENSAHDYEIDNEGI